MESDEFVPIKRACREAGTPRAYSRVYRAIRENRYSGAVRDGSRGKEVRPADLEAYLAGDAGDGDGADPGASPGHVGARTASRTKGSPKRKAAPPPRPSPAVAALRDELEVKRLQRSLEHLESAEGDWSVKAELAAEEQRRRWEREDRERELERRRLDREAWMLRWRSEFDLAAVKIGQYFESATASEIRQAISAVVEATCARMWPHPEMAQPDDAAVRAAIDAAAADVTQPYLERFQRDLDAKRRAREEKAALELAAMARERKKRKDEELMQFLLLAQTMSQRSARDPALDQLKLAFDQLAAMVGQLRD